MFLKVLLCNFSNTETSFFKEFTAFTKSSCLKKAAKFQEQNNVFCTSMQFIKK